MALFNRSYRTITRRKDLRKFKKAGRVYYLISELAIAFPDEPVPVDQPKRRRRGRRRR
jgi:hypothetical protein